MPKQITKPQTPQQFFYEQAGWSYDPKKETQEQGRQRGAKKLAHAEKKARAMGMYFRWSIDPHIDSSEFTKSKPSWKLWQCCAYLSDGGIVASLHGIDFGRDKEPWGEPYRRVVEAELALEGFHNKPQYEGRGQ